MGLLKVNFLHISAVNFLGRSGKMTFERVLILDNKIYKHFLRHQDDMGITYNYFRIFGA